MRHCKTARVVNNAMEARALGGFMSKLLIVLVFFQ